jgi:hypothetical protein
MNTKLVRLAFSVGLAVLFSAAVLFVGPGEAQTAVRGETTSILSQELTHTLYLPLATRSHLPGYVSPFGIVMYGDVDDEAGLQKMEDAGSKWVTTFLYWSKIEPSDDSYNWSSFDTKAQNAQAAGMDVFVLLKSNPSWAAPTPNGPVSDTRKLEEFVADAAERYDCDGYADAPQSPCVHYWSFYPEPDSKNLWGDGDEYAAMLSQISPAIHNANSEARVLIGGVAYDWFEENGGPFVRSFLTDTLSALNTYPGKAEAYIDAVAFHFYPISEARWPTIREKADEIQGIMGRYGVEDLPLICPEMGYWSAEEAPLPSSEAIQANRLVQMFVRGLSAGIEQLSWLGVFDHEEGTTNEHGLFWNRDLNQPKTSYEAYGTMTQELAYVRYLRQLGSGSDVEGYVFRMLDGREKTVLWATGSQTTATFPYSCVRLVDNTGQVYDPINDGDATWDWDGQVNGQIELAVYQDTPFYVEPCH